MSPKNRKHKQNQIGMLEMKTNMHLKMDNLLDALNIKINQIKASMTIRKERQ